MWFNVQLCLQTSVPEGLSKMFEIQRDFWLNPLGGFDYTMSKIPLTKMEIYNSGLSHCSRQATVAVRCPQNSPGDVKNRISIWSSNSLLCWELKAETQSAYAYHIHILHTHVQSSIIYNSQKVEATHKTINRWEEKQNVVQTYCEIYSTGKSLGWSGSNALAAHVSKPNRKLLHASRLRNWNWRTTNLI